MASQRKRPKGFPNHVSLWREPEGLSPDGGLRTPTNRKPHQTGEPRGLSPSGGNSAAKPFSLEYPRAPRARCGVQGDTPCREPRGPSPSGGLGDESVGNARPSAERSQSAILICIALRAYGVQSGVKGHCPLLVEGLAGDGVFHDLLAFIVADAGQNFVD